MEYNRQVAVGGAVAAEAAKAKGTTADQRDMAFATVTLAEKDNNGQQKSSNVGCAGLVDLYAWTLQHASLTTCPMSLKTDFMMCCTLAWQQSYCCYSQRAAESGQCVLQLIVIQ